MINEEDFKTIKEITENLLQKMTIIDFNIKLKKSFVTSEDSQIYNKAAHSSIIGGASRLERTSPIAGLAQGRENGQKIKIKDEFSLDGILPEQETKTPSSDMDIIDLDIELKDPQILIGPNGQTLFELQRILKIILNKRLNKFFHLRLDINNYKKQKIEYLKHVAKDTADIVFITKQKKVLPPMPAYQRRIIHTELADRRDVITESEGVGDNRYIVVSPR